LPFHIRPPVGAPQLGAAAACVLALFVAGAQPVASLAWLAGAHATPEQAALHKAAVEHGYTDHHGAPGHHAHEPPRGDDETYAHASGPALGQDFASASTHAGPLQNLLQTLLQAMLVAPPDAPSPGEAPRGASPADGLPSQHSPPVPDRPPVSLLPHPAIL
jgi:hypothetical protein